MDANEIANVLDNFASLPRSLTLQEIFGWAAPDVSHKTLLRSLVSDKRFVILGKRASDEIFLVPERALFRWFANLNLRLAQARQVRLTARQLADSISSLRLDGRWDVPPVEAVDFGHKFGFIASAWTPDQYVFPLARLLSYFSTLGIRVAESVLENFAEKENRDTAFQEPIEYWVKEGLSQFGERVVYVVQQREGLLTGAKATLEQIGTDLGLSRERIRQIEARFWEKLSKLSKHPKRYLIQTPFRKGFLCEIMRRQGSLVISAEAFSIRFIAKCVGIPYAEVPNTGLVILGALPEDIASVDSLGQWSELIDADAIATRLEAEGRLCLSDSDLGVVCERVADFHLKRLTKAQKVYLALRSIGRLAHYSEVAEEYSRLFPDDPSTENNIHAVLSREEQGVVWIGAKGTFALREWGYERPSRKLYEAVTEIVQKKYDETGKAVPFVVIAAEIGRDRQVVNSTSLTFAVHCNPNLRRVSKDSFIPKGPNDEVQDEISADELDRILREFQEGS